MNNMLLIVLLASAAANSLAGEHKSLVNGMILVAAIIGWSYVFNWLSYKVLSLWRLFQPSAMVVFKDGKMPEEVMVKELTMEKKLKGKLRRKGADDISNLLILIKIILLFLFHNRITLTGKCL